MSYFGQIDPTPPPVRPTSWPMVAGWVALIGAAGWVLHSAVNLKANRRTRRRRKSSRRNPSSRRLDELEKAIVGPKIEFDMSRSRLARYPYEELRQKLISELGPEKFRDLQNKVIRRWEKRRQAGLPIATRNPRRSSHARAKPTKMSELGVWEAIGAVRAAHPREHLDVLPPGVVAKFKKLPPGLYKYGFGNKGEAISRFKNATLKGAMTSTRIGASKVGQYHWLVDNFDPSFPVVVRGIDDHGRSYFRIEEYAKRFERVPVYAQRRASAR